MHKQSPRRGQVKGILGKWLVLQDSDLREGDMASTGARRLGLGQCPHSTGDKAVGSSKGGRIFSMIPGGLPR